MRRSLQPARSPRAAGRRRAAIIGSFPIAGIDNSSRIPQTMMILEEVPSIAVTMRFVLNVATGARAFVLAAFALVMSTASRRSRRRQDNHGGNGSAQ
jgi:hypothetical protein